MERELRTRVRENEKKEVVGRENRMKDRML